MWQQADQLGSGKEGGIRVQGKRAKGATCWQQLSKKVFPGFSFGFSLTDVTRTVIEMEMDFVYSLKLCVCLSYSSVCVRVCVGVCVCVEVYSMQLICLLAARVKVQHAGVYFRGKFID